MRNHNEKEKNEKLEAFEDDDELEPFPDDDELEPFPDERRIRIFKQLDACSDHILSIKKIWILSIKEIWKEGLEAFKELEYFFDFITVGKQAYKEAFKMDQIVIQAC